MPKITFPKPKSNKFIYIKISQFFLYATATVITCTPLLKGGSVNIGEQNTYARLD